jgi:hypothetical protein
MKRSLWMVLVTLAVLSFSTAGFADVLDPLDNMSAPPGTFVFLTYTGQAHFPDYADNNGDDIEFDLDQSFLLLRPLYVIGKIADKFTYGVNAVIPIAHLSLGSGNEMGLPSVSEFGLGDIVLSPFIFLYENTDSQFYISLWEFVNLPTGDYSENNAVNIGRDTWFFQHQIALGWYPGKFGLDVCLNYWHYLESDKLKIQEPPAIELEAVVSYGVTDKFRVGVNAAYWIGLDDWEYDGVTDPDTEPRNFKLGLNLSYVLQENFIVGMRWMHDVDSENYVNGDWAYLRLTYIF